MDQQDRRLILDDYFRKVAEEFGFKGNVYYEPLPSVKMHYDAIVYSRSYIHTQHADNRPYIKRDRYTVTCIHQSPTAKWPDKIGDLPMCEFEREFVSDNLHHTVYVLYY